MSPVTITPANSIFVDNESREKIICNHPYTNYLDKNLFVIAGAGSGKTFMLVNRMVKMVEEGKDVSQICAITFTKKAAAEFLERFRNVLKERSVVPEVKSTSRKPGFLPDPTTTTAAYCKEALKNIDLCFTGTIDSFCNLVLSEYPNNAGIPSSSGVALDDELAGLYKKEYKKIANNPSHPLRSKLDAFNALFPNGAEVFGKSIGAIMKYAHLTIDFNPPAVDAITALHNLESKYYQKIMDDLATINGLRASVVNLPQFVSSFDRFQLEYAKLQKPWALDNINTFKKGLKSSLFVDKEKIKIRFISQPTLLFYNSKYVNSTTSNGVKIPGGYEISFDSPDYCSFVDEVNNLIYTYALDFLIDVAKCIREELKKQGKLSYSEYLLTFRDMVKKDLNSGMHLIEHIRKKHKYFLLDESQDTSPLQTELFLYLCSEVPATRIEDCKPIPGSIFIVGDPKQSIYSFRGADVNAYLKTEKLFENVYDSNTHEVVYLTQNFRSSLEMCDYFNNQFKNLPSYYDIPTNNIEQPDISIRGKIISGVFSSPNYVEAIRALVGKHEIFDTKLLAKEKKQLEKNPNLTRTYGKRPIEYKDIMLLTWSTTNHDVVIKKLKEEKIPFYCEGRFFLNNCDILQTIYAFLLYIANEPGSFENVLSSPLFGLLPKEYATIASISELPNSNQKDLFAAIDLLKDSDDSPIILFEKIIRIMETYEFVDFANIEYVLFVLEKVKEGYNSGTISDLSSMLGILKETISIKLEKYANLEKEPNAVFLANTHKVKGLERPVVILVEATSNAKPSDDDSDFVSGKAYIFKASKNEFGHAVSYDIDSGNKYVNEINASKNKNADEALRLGYVAATRARNVLIIPPESQSNSAWRGVRPSSALPPIPNPTINEDVSPKQASTFNPIPLPSFNAKATYVEMSPSKLQPAQSKQSVNQVSAGQVNVAQANNDAGLKGTIAHRLMQMLVNSKGQINKQQMVDTILNEYYLEKGSVYETLLNKVYDTMTSGGFPNQPDKGVPQDLLKELSGASEVYCECPYSFFKDNKDNKEVWQGTIDLLYVKGGKYYIIDYKTDANTTNIVANHIMQLEAYKKAIKLFNNADAEAYIYHIDIK